VFFFVSHSRNIFRNSIKINSLKMIITMMIMMMMMKRQTELIDKQAKLIINTIHVCCFCFIRDALICCLLPAPSTIPWLFIFRNKK
jgi:hypothetical protein